MIEFRIALDMYLISTNLKDCSLEELARSEQQNNNSIHPKRI